MIYFTLTPENRTLPHIHSYSYCSSKLPTLCTYLLRGGKPSYSSSLCTADLIPKPSLEHFDLWSQSVLLIQPHRKVEALIGKWILGNLTLQLKSSVAVCWAPESRSRRRGRRTSTRKGVLNVGRETVERSGKVFAARLVQTSLARLRDHRERRCQKTIRNDPCVKRPKKKLLPISDTKSVVAQAE